MEPNPCSPTLFPLSERVRSEGSVLSTLYEDRFIVSLHNGILRKAPRIKSKACSAIVWLTSAPQFVTTMPCSINERGTVFRTDPVIRIQ